MSGKLKTLRFLKNQITRIENKAKDLDKVSYYSIKHYLDELESYFIDFSKYYDEENLSEVAELEFEEYGDRYQNAKALMLDRIDLILQRKPGDNLNESGSHDGSLAGLLERQNQIFEAFAKASIGNQRSETNRLPHLKIPIFRGDSKEWTKFKNLFRSIVHESRTLSNAEKMNHLLTLLEAEPLSLVSHFPISGENYKDAWDLLVGEYDNEYILVKGLVEEVVNMPAMATKGGSLRKLWSILSETIQSLANMDIYGESRDPWIVYLVVNKFDEDTARKWAEEVVTNPRPSVESLLTFLRNLSSTEKVLGSSAQQKTPRTIIKTMSATVNKCFVCGEEHKIFRCNKFQKLSIKERDKLVKDKSRCVNCLGTGHFSSKCGHKGSCFHCRKRHHTLLHFGGYSKNESSSQQSPNLIEPKENEALGNKKTEETELIRVHIACDKSVTAAILPTAIIEIRDGFGIFQRCRVLLDCGAQASFITERCFKKLNLARQQVRVPIQFVSGPNTFYSRGMVTTNIRTCSTGSFNSRADLLILPKITDRLPDRKLSLSCTDEIKRKFELADPSFDLPEDVDISLGADHFFALVGAKKYFSKNDNVWILESALGWLVSGGSVMDGDRVLSVNSVSHSTNLDKILENFWCMEEPTVQHTMTPEDEMCEKLFDETTVREKDGRYSVDLPFKEPRVQVGESLNVALNRFQSLERKFRVNPKLRERYHTLIDLFLEEGYLEPIPDDKIDIPTSKRFYLPHYGLYRSETDPSKLRIVFDASVKSDNGVCLNDCIMTGPKYQTEIFHMLLQFRIPHYVFMADIRKMYRQIKINPNHREFQRILWRRSEDESIKHFRLTTLMDGVNAAPYLALRTMSRLATDEADRFPLGAKALSNRYMDDFFVGKDDIGELVMIRDELIQILASACMSLDKWAANDDGVLSGIEQVDRRLDSNIELESTSIVKTLGVRWNFRGDYFCFSYNSDEVVRHSKRSLLSEAAKIFDPCGWLAPVTVLYKIIFQKTWLRRLGWDEVLPEDLREDWFNIKCEMSALSSIKFPRWIGSSKRIEVHGFCDASAAAFAAVVYLRLTDESGNVTTTLLGSKTKLCPLKSVSIPRLELCGAHLLSRLLCSMSPILEELDVNVHCWSDSKIVLAWLASPPSKWKSFVANRCSHINELLPRVPWRYIKSELNPADMASRGVRPMKLTRSELWWQGPRWLKDDWVTFFRDEGFTTSMEERPILAATTKKLHTFFMHFVGRFSCFRRFQRSFAYIIKFFWYLRRGKNVKPVPLSGEDIAQSTQLFVKLIQRQSFENDVSSLAHDEKVSRSSQLANLSPFLDQEGLMRVGGRLSEATISYEMKHPVIIPHGHFLNLLITYVHEKYYHAGLKLTISLIRQSYFATRMRSLVKSVINQCVVCIRMKGKTYDPMMGGIPRIRLDYVKPFEVSGIDFAGPVTVRPYLGRGKTNIKSFIAVMVCMATKAVHLELVSGLGTEHLIMALKRFLSRYGHCKTIYSDNGKNFVGCNNLLRELGTVVSKCTESTELKSFILDNLITWRFIPPYTPHFGGIWEAAVKSTKHHLSRVLQGRTPTIEELMTMLAEISAILNSRPLSPLTDDIDDFGVLTPAHLVQGYPMVHLPLLNTRVGDVVTGVGRYRDIGALVGIFWKKWRNEYFQDYLKRVKWKHPGRTATIGDLVLIKRAANYPTLWTRGRVVGLHPGKDDIVRVVDVKTSMGVRRESARNLVPIILKPDDASMGGVCPSENT